MYKFKIAIPTREDIDASTLSKFGHIPASDFAIATGVDCISQFTDPMECPKSRRPRAIWISAVGDTPGKTMQIYAPGNEADFTERPCDDLSVGVVPVFTCPNEQGIEVAKYNGRDVLTINGKVAFYPQTKLSQTADTVKLRGQRTSDLIFIQEERANGLFGGTSHQPYANHVLSHDGELFCELRKTVNRNKSNGNYNTFRDGTNCINREPANKYMRFEPIEAETLPNGNIICREALMAAIIDEKKDFKNYCRAYKLKPGDMIEVLEHPIGRYLNGVFWSSIQDATQRMAISALDVAGMKERERAQEARALKKVLCVGATVKIKYEGRYGVIKKIAEDTAILAVDGRPLTYRIEDLMIEQ